MAFITLTAVPSSAVASSGTLAFTAPNTNVGGLIKYAGLHKMYAEGLQAMFTAPADFTVSTSGATVTVTYNGTTSLPASKAVMLQLEVYGEDSWLTQAFPETVKDVYGNIRALLARPVRVVLGSPVAGSATAILNAQALAVTTVQTLTTPYVMDAPRAVTIKSSSTDTAVITIRGTDEFGNAMTESLTLNGTSAVNGKKAFKTVISYQAAGGAPSNNLSIGTTNIFGLPFFLPGGTSAGIGYVLKEIQDGAVATAGTVVGGDTTKATATTGDVRGTVAPNTTPDGAKVYECVIMATDVTYQGVPQYAG